MPVAGRINCREKTTVLVEFQIQDEAGDGIPGSGFVIILVSIYNRGSPTPLIRSSDDLLNDEHFACDDEGNVTWELTPADTALISTSIGLGQQARHVIYVEFGWDADVAHDDPGESTLTNPFATTADSQTVTVTHAGHGLAVRDAVYLQATAAVGGLDMDGLYIVSEVVDADHYRIAHNSAASSTVAAGGGTVSWWHRLKTGSEEIELIVQRADAV